ncbi:23S rRNA (guanosine(2251)-2'-O)-methyltransferase RlmB [Leeuwenhoekiella parthenopeia]|uniref:23S rRNA (Guanosine(2251)-2'-O)-methyltransferase RlmB n=1 Tax=Leeuwenhoekiella parthenopeia TaxID=2890320 RepID=A0ABS8GRD7_9FLAO|nr:23S rRNA (guanosine(2251)-2'-O)-methyltransferase RlmB [Leeuwenhoekiella parthenopeia]MCC4212520.1 23S rRNA (guanosine(2251)-2'-O)-methyltransferase RlmB [Leeuwenhoekiella parthenopeia]
MSKNTHIYGTRAIIEAINAGKEIGKIYLQKGLNNPLFKELELLIRDHGISTSYVPQEKLYKLSDQNHQGAIATISPIQFADFEATAEAILMSEKPGLFLLLDQLTDVRNFGAIIRTAACTGVDAIIIPKSGGAPVTDDTVKTSAGAIFNIPICKVDHIKDALFYLQGSGVQVVAATEKTEDSIYDLDYTTPTALVMGSEGKGVTAGVLKLVDHKAKLPMTGSISSLNVSVACGAFLYEIVRQRR